MNSTNAKDYLPLVQALSEGRVIQYRYQKSSTSYDWLSLESDIDFKMPADSYRIKPEPREIWRNRFPDGVEFGAFDSIEQARQSHIGKAKQVCYREVLE